MIRMKQIQWGAIFDYLFALVLVLDCRSIYVYIHFLNGRFGDLIYLLLLFSVIGKLFSQHIVPFGNDKQKMMADYLVFSLALMLLIIVHHFDKNSILLMAKATLVFLFLFLDKREGGVPGILFKYRDIICLIAIVSLAFWVCGSMLSIIKPSGVVYSDWSGASISKRCLSYYYVYFETQKSDAAGVLASLLVRNSAIFTEAPMASFHFTLALLIEFFLTPAVSKKRMCLLIAATISTIATTGFCVLLLILARHFITKKSKNHSVQFLKIPIVVFGAIACIVLMYKLIIVKLDSSSGSVRIDDYKVCFRAWLRHPLFGCGIGNNDFIKSFMEKWRTQNQGLSNSLGQILAQGGLTLFSFYAISIIRGMVHGIRLKKTRQFWFCAFFVLIFSITVVSYNLIVITILLWFASIAMAKEKSLDRLLSILYKKTGWSRE